MHNIIHQIFYEGMGASIYEPLERVAKKIKNTFLRNMIIIILKIDYILLIIAIAAILIYISYPFK